VKGGTPLCGRVDGSYQIIDINRFVKGNSVINKCPKCEKVIIQFRINTVVGAMPFKNKWNCVSICCPYCHTVLSVQIDPIAIKADTVNELAQRLGGLPT
jgi:hypothetical protein